MAFGEVFAPTTDNAQMATRGGQRSQGPLRTLSFQLPKTGGQPRAGSSVGHAVLQSVLRTVLGHDAANTLSGSPAAPRVSGGAPASMAGGLPAPRDPSMSAPDFSAAGTPSPMGQPRASRTASTGAPNFGNAVGEQDPFDPNATGGSSGVVQTRPFNPTSADDMAHVDDWAHVDTNGKPYIPRERAPYNGPAWTTSPVNGKPYIPRERAPYSGPAFVTNRDPFAG